VPRVLGLLQERPRMLQHQRAEPLVLEVPGQRLDAANGVGLRVAGWGRISSKIFEARRRKLGSLGEVGRLRGELVDGGPPDRITEEVALLGEESRMRRRGL